jgi:hypothetical protein
LDNDLLKAVEMLGPNRALEMYDRRLEAGSDAWEIHLELFPVVQRVLNPPFINPHLPKMYNICCEFFPYLDPEDIPALVRLEVTEYARRAKLEELPKTSIPDSVIHFEEIETAIGKRNWKTTASLMAVFHHQQGGQEFARRLLLLGSGYLDRSLGHSISGTTFILLEMLERKDQDPWPVIAALADYFCNGRFKEAPELISDPTINSNGDLRDQLLRAVSGRGILNLHHPITLYAIERVRFLFDAAHYNHLIAQWIKFMGDKVADRIEFPFSTEKAPADYSEFYEKFSQYEREPVLRWAAGMMGSSEGRKILGRYLIKAVCDQYRGHYNPHNLTGLGSTLWIMENWWDDPEVALTALYQFVDYFFEDIRPEKSNT